MVQKPAAKAVPSKNVSAPAKKAASSSDDDSSDEDSDEDEVSNTFHISPGIVDT
jgi:hypothetical protein